MATNLQIEANRRNAQRSTGPKTLEGRAVSRMNALKHGLTAEHILLFDEVLEDFERFHHDITVSLGAKGAVESQLAERLALCAWRLRRVYRIETRLFSKGRTSWRNGKTETTSDIDLVFLRLTGQGDELSKLLRYERSLERSLQRALYALERRQMQRKGHPPLRHWAIEGKFAPQPQPERPSGNGQEPKILPRSELARTYLPS
jgi:hypothetical protein